MPARQVLSSEIIASRSMVPAEELRTAEMDNWPGGGYRSVIHSAPGDGVSRAALYRGRGSRVGSPRGDGGRRSVLQDPRRRSLGRGEAELNLRNRSGRFDPGFPFRVMPPRVGE